MKGRQYRWLCSLAEQQSRSLRYIYKEEWCCCEDEDLDAELKPEDSPGDGRAQLCAASLEIIYVTDL